MPTDVASRRRGIESATKWLNRYGVGRAVFTAAETVRWLLAIAALPKGAALPIVRAMKLQWRPLSDAWATRQLQVAIRPDADATVVALRDFLLPTSQSAKAERARFK